MAGKTRVEFEGAVYHLFDWGAWREAMFLDSRDRAWPARYHTGHALLVGRRCEEQFPANEVHAAAAKAAGDHAESHRADRIHPCGEHRRHAHHAKGKYPDADHADRDESARDDPAGDAPDCAQADGYDAARHPRATGGVIAKGHVDERQSQPRRGGFPLVTFALPVALRGPWRAAVRTDDGVMAHFRRAVSAGGKW